MEKYTHFDARVRKLIAVKFNDGFSYGRIAKELNVSKSAVWYEVQRNKVEMIEKVRVTGHLWGRPIRAIDKQFMYDPAYADQRALNARTRAERVPSYWYNGYSQAHRSSPLSKPCSKVKG